MKLVRNKDNRWISICADCLDSGVDINLLENTNIVIDDMALQAPSSPSIDVTLLPDPVANARKLYESLKTLRQSSERVGRSRGHERKKTNLTVHFIPARDDARYSGTVMDFSPGGPKFKN